MNDAPLTKTQDSTLFHDMKMESEHMNVSPLLKQMIRDRVTSNGGSLQSLESCSTENNIHVLREVIRKRQPHATLEIGLANGASALTILASLEEFSGGVYMHTSIDPFQQSLWMNVGRQLVENQRLAGHFELIEEFSSQALPRLLSEGKTYDLVYVDGSHTFDNVFIDYYYSVRLLEKGGVILFDDCTTEDVANVIRYISSRQNTVLRELDLDPFRNPNRSWISRVGKVLGRSQIRGFEKICDMMGFVEL
jgi:predicted O-methyltransferase YrrM